MKQKVACRSDSTLIPQPGLPHVHYHQVGEDEVTDVLEKPGEDRLGKEGSRMALGQTGAGRYLRVAYVPEPTACS